MKLSVLLTACLFAFLSLNTAQFPIEKRLMVLKKTNSKEILIDRNALSNWCNKHYMSGLIAFETMSTVKVSKERYYLIGKEFHSNRIFAFELEKVKKQLWLSYKNEMHICNSGDGFGGFRVVDNKIIGCKSGGHTISINQ